MKDHYQERLKELLAERHDALRAFADQKAKSTETIAKIKRINALIQQLKREAKKNGVKMEEAGE